MSLFVGVQLYDNEQIFHAAKPVALYCFMSHVIIVGNVYWQPTTGKHHKLKLFLRYIFFPKRALALAVVLYSGLVILEFL